jgi:hypothetical protein
MFKALFNLLWGFMVVFSFIVNIVLVVIVAVLGWLIFDIKNEVADPLLKGLHSSFVGLDEATIDWTIPVRDSVNAQFVLPLEQNTVVVLTEPVPLRVQADISGPVAINNATVALTLPEGTRLPVSLDLDVPVDEQIPVDLDVRAVIPLENTQLHDPFQNLRLTFEPIILALDNLPNNFGEAFVAGSGTVAGQPPDLFDPSTSEYLQDPWPGFSLTAGLGYDLLDESRRLNQPGAPVQGQSAGQPGQPNVVQTGLVPQGGIPYLDQQLRPEVYESDGAPDIAIQEASAALEALGIPRESYTGDFDDLQVGEQPAQAAQPAEAQSATGDEGEMTGGPTGNEITPEAPQPAFTPADGEGN